MPVAVGRTLGKVVRRKVGNRLNRVVRALPGTLVRIDTSPYRKRFSGKMGRNFGQAFNNALSDLTPTHSRYRVAIADKRVPKKAKHYFTRDGWQKFGRVAYLKLRAQGFKPKIRRKRGGHLLDAYQALAGAGAIGVGLATRRRRRMN